MNVARGFRAALALLASVVLVGAAGAQEEAPAAAEGVADKAQQTLDAAQETASAVVDSVDQNAQAQEISAGLLQPIYRLAESFEFPAFHWFAFALMASAVVSFALQLTLGKLVVLGHAGFSPREILSDAMGLLVSLVGLVLTTQAAAQNSTFTQSATAVLSSAGVGAVLGFVFYLWGQSQEVQAARGRRRAAEKAPPADEK